MSFNKLYNELNDMGLMSRAMAIGKEADAELTLLENKEKPVKHERKVKRVCLYCGEESEKSDFILTHKCNTPTIVEKKNWPCPSRPKEVRFFEVVYNKKTYKFLDYFSAMRFRNLVWIESIPLCNALDDKHLRWYK